MTVEPQLVLPIIYVDDDPPGAGTPLESASFNPQFDAIRDIFNEHTHLVGPDPITFHVDNLLDYVLSPIIRKPGVKQISIENVVIPPDFAPFGAIVAWVLTRVFDGDWQTAALIYNNQGVLTNAAYNIIYASPGLGNSSVVIGPPATLTLLDETRILVQTYSENDGTPQGPPIDILPESGPGSMNATLPLGFGSYEELFALEVVDPGLPNQPLTMISIDDPILEDHFLTRVILGTDSDGNILSSLRDLNIAGCGFFSISSQNTDASPIIPLAKTYIASGAPGTVVPLTFDVVVR